MIFGPAQIAPFSMPTDPAFVVAHPAIVHGWALRETSGVNPAVVDLCDGPTGPRIAPFALCKGESMRDWLSGTGIYANVGLYVRVVSGTVDGTLWYRATPTPAHRSSVDVADVIDQILDRIWEASR